MELKEALQRRRSVRKFTDEKVSEEDINELLHAAMSGPSAVNKKPWDFYVITDEEMLEKVRKHCAPFGKFKSPLAIVVCGNLLKALPLNLSTYWIQDCSAATENILLRACDLGLGAVWCGAYPVKASVKSTRKTIGAKAHQVPLNVIFIGHPDGDVPEPRDQYDEKCIHRI